MEKKDTKGSCKTAVLQGFSLKNHKASAKTTGLWNILTVFSLAALCGMLGGCAKQAEFNVKKSIEVISREDGSGTRGAFIELFGIEQKGADGSRKDLTTKEAVIARQTDIVMTNIAGNKYAIGYISLGSLNSTVKSLAIDGAAANAENVRTGLYPVTRPFFIAVSSRLSDEARDFIDFILSAEGQAVVGINYIPAVPDAAGYSGQGMNGKIVAAGSSSVSPVMEKLREAYLALNPGSVIEVQQSDSSTGIATLIDGNCDIAMVSRHLKNEEEAAGLRPLQIAIDGIAVIVHNQNPLVNAAKEDVKAIFTGAFTTWEAVLK